MSVEILAAPELKVPREKVAQHLRKEKSGHIFLRFPRTMEEYTAQFREGLPYDYVMEELRKSKIIPEPIKAWEYSAEPLLKVLPQIEETEIHCYGDSLYTQEGIKNLIEVATLSLISSITGKVDTEKWRKLFEKDKESQKSALRREADLVITKTSSFENSVCVANSNTDYLISELKAEGFEVKVEYIGFSSSPIPLENLRREIAKEDTTDERIKELVRLHIKYIKEYIFTSKNPDEAYQRWVLEQRDKSKG